MTRLDAVESNGDTEVRGRRKEVVKEVERALREMERQVEESHERSWSRERARTPAFSTADQTAMELAPVDAEAVAPAAELHVSSVPEHTVFQSRADPQATAEQSAPASTDSLAEELSAMPVVSADTNPVQDHSSSTSVPSSSEDSTPASASTPEGPTQEQSVSAVESFASVHDRQPPSAENYPASMEGSSQFREVVTVGASPAAELVPRQAVAASEASVSSAVSDAVNLHTINLHTMAEVSRLLVDAAQDVAAQSKSSNFDVQASPEDTIPETLTQPLKVENATQTSEAADRQLIDVQASQEVPTSRSRDAALGADVNSASAPESRGTLPSDQHPLDASAGAEQSSRSLSPSVSDGSTSESDAFLLRSPASSGAPRRPRNSEESDEEIEVIQLDEAQPDDTDTGSAVGSESGSVDGWTDAKAEFFA